MISLTDWLTGLELERYASIFIDNEVDFHTLQILTDNDLKELGLPFGPRKRLLNALAEMKVAETARVAGTSERRQLTVLFCDMVGFTELAHRVDPEVLEKILRAYEDSCALCITRYDGYVFQRLGDGIVAFFGFPLAHEGEAERAIRAGLEILQAMENTDVPEVGGRVRVRIGIATGIVVVSSTERTAVGETMNLASRLQTLAQPDTLVVSERVHRLAGGVFDYLDLGKHNLKGINQPARVYQVLGVGAAETRFDAAAGAGLTRLVGREPELGVLRHRWELARNGKGQAVLLSGEPGIGKSRMLSALCENLQPEGPWTLRFQCSPFFGSSAFHPIIAVFGRALDFERDESNDSKLDKLEALLVGRCGQRMEDVRLIAAILSIPFQQRYGALNMSPQLAKSETNRILVSVVTVLAQQNPGLLLFEDLHWADPTSVELLGMLLDQLSSMRLLVILTHRPEFDIPWPAQAHISRLSLAHLAETESLQLVSSSAGGRELPPELAQQIVVKADGVPLFIEELTRAILASGDLVQEEQRYTYRASSASVSLPETLRDSLAARLDGVPAAKKIAQVGAVIGREFSYEILAALELMPERALSRALAVLTESGLASHDRDAPSGLYAFKHALVQDAAYDSLLKSERQPLHRRIASVIEERWPEIRERQPELLAHHYTAGGAPEIAIPFWRRAGESARQSFALTEAITHLRKGLALLKEVPRSAERDRMEAALRMALAPAIIAQSGWGNSEVSSILEPAWMLAESLGHYPSYLPILSALSVHYMCVGEIRASLVWADRLLAAGAAMHDDAVEVVGHRAASASYYWRGDFLSARKHGDILQSLYNADRHWHIAQLTNFDPYTGEGIYRAQYLWMLGYPDQAAAASDAKDEHARRRNHPFDLAFALTLGAQVFDLRGEPDQLLRRTEEAERVGREHGVPLLSEIMTDISRGIALLRSGQAHESAIQLERGIARIAATGHRIWIWYLKALQAEALALTGDMERASELIDESVLRMQTAEERVHYSEILRLKGWLLMLQGKTKEAEVALYAALNVAREQQAKSWELRSATTLARLLMDCGETQSAREILAPVYGWFSEGFGTKDLIEAEALLAKLQKQSIQNERNKHAQGTARF